MDCQTLECEAEERIAYHLHDTLSDENEAVVRLAAQCDAIAPAFVGSALADEFWVRRTV